MPTSIHIHTCTQVRRRERQTKNKEFWKRMLKGGHHAKERCVAVRYGTMSSGLYSWSLPGISAALLCCAFYSQAEKSVTQSQPSSYSTVHKQSRGPFSLPKDEVILNSNCQAFPDSFSKYGNNLGLQTFQIPWKKKVGTQPLYHIIALQSHKFLKLLISYFAYVFIYHLQ